MQIWSKMMIVILLVLQVTVASAESVRRDGDSGGNDARKAQLLMRQLAQAKSQLEAENANMAAEVQALQAQVRELEAELGEKAKSLKTSRASNDKLLERVNDDKRKLQLLMEKYRDTVQLLRVERANVGHLKLAVQERNEWIDKCKANNDSMYQVNLELVDRYRNKGFWQELTQAEPLTGMGDVKMEVIAEEYRYRLEDLQVANFESQVDKDQ